MVFYGYFEGVLLEACDFGDYGYPVCVLEHVDEGFGFFVFAFAEAFWQAVFLWVGSGCFEAFHARGFGFLWRGYVDVFEV